MVSSNQHDVGTDSSSEHKELSLEERLEKVRRDAYAAGFAEGEVDGFIDGREQGFAAGYDESFAEGHAVGFTDGYKWGFSQGKLLGYGTGLRKGRYEGLDAGTSEDYLLGYEKGLEAGEKEGFEDGRNFRPVRMTHRPCEENASKKSYLKPFMVSTATLAHAAIIVRPCASELDIT